MNSTLANLLSKSVKGKDLEIMSLKVRIAELEVELMQVTMMAQELKHNYDRLLGRVKENQ